ncbi:MAG: hypothetical protein AAFZ74_00445 [Pseudomonadota bacterium]
MTAISVLVFGFGLEANAEACVSPDLMAKVESRVLKPDKSEVYRSRWARVLNSFHGYGNQMSLSDAKREMKKRENGRARWQEIVDALQCMQNAEPRGGGTVVPGKHFSKRGFADQSDRVYGSQTGYIAWLEAKVRPSSSGTLRSDILNEESEEPRRLDTVSITDRRRESRGGGGAPLIRLTPVFVGGGGGGGGRFGGPTSAELKNLREKCKSDEDRVDALAKQSDKDIKAAEAAREAAGQEWVEHAVVFYSTDGGTTIKSTPVQVGEVPTSPNIGGQIQVEWPSGQIFRLSPYASGHRAGAWEPFLCDSKCL